MTDVMMHTEPAATLPCSTKKASVPQVECSLHPLVIINISEHWTRVRAQSRDKAAQKVFGAVLGKVDEGHVEMVNSFELRMFTLDGHTRFNEEFLRQRLGQYKEVFPELDLVGWYCTGEDGIEQDEILLQSLFAVAIDSPLLVKLNPTINPQGKRNVPVKVFYSRETPLVSTGHELTEVEWTLVSEQSERIGIDHITRLSQAFHYREKMMWMYVCVFASADVQCLTMASIQAGDDGAVSIEAKQMRAAGSAVSMLLDKIGIICEYLKGVQEGKYPANDEIIREANKICQRLPLLKPAEFDDGFKAQERDARAAMLLAKMTEICGTLSSLQAKTNLLGTITAWRSIATIPQQQPKKKSTQRVTAVTAPAAPIAADVGANNVAHSPDVD
ncbi:Mov34/MPN/PAD-1 family protein [Ancylostoma ceylanicum]|uniref:COP9 signalosome complex subunit 6 n=1 Tax=Ancylostoma ceylanicum TaxID=53326 RepID=A0A0D6M5K0_9BILA|nr:Mov34/MPN/PAD-1 family protein [Ancylostoma ceylanicum]